jgi:hypothetical protein
LLRKRGADVPSPGLTEEPSSLRTAALDPALE